MALYKCCIIIIIINAVFAVMQCLSVTFVDHVKTNKRIFEIFSPSGSDTILLFSSQRGCRYSDGNPPNGGVECNDTKKYQSFLSYALYSPLSDLTISSPNHYDCIVLIIVLYYCVLLFYYCILFSPLFSLMATIF